MLRALLLAAVALASSPGAAMTEPLRVGVEPDVPPLSFIDDAGTARGIMPEIARTLCQRIAAECVLVPVRFERLMPALREGAVDVVVAAIAATDERRKDALFTPAFARSPARFVMRRGEADGYVSPSKLKGKALAAQSGTTFANFLEDNYPDSTFRAYARLEEALAALAAGAVDGVLADQVALADWLLREPGRSCCELTGPELSDPAWLADGFSIAVRKGEPNLARRLGEAAAAIRADGAFGRLNEAFAPFRLE
jgi:polar amino acid transport system substrate-binding protein